MSAAGFAGGNGTFSPAVGAGAVVTTGGGVTAGGATGVTGVAGVVGLVGVTVFNRKSSGGYGVSVGVVPGVTAELPAETAPSGVKSCNGGPRVAHIVIPIIGSCNAVATIAFEYGD